MFRFVQKRFSQKSLLTFLKRSLLICYRDTEILNIEEIVLTQIEVHSGSFNLLLALTCVMLFNSLFEQIIYIVLLMAFSNFQFLMTTLKYFQTFRLYFMRCKMLLHLIQ